MSSRMELLEQLSVWQLSEPRSRIWSVVDDESTPPSSQPGIGSKFTVTSESEVVVVPATKTDHPKWLSLTNLDRVVNPTFISVIFFYENVLSDKGDGKTFQDVTADLKDSLAKVLVEFYPLAGRLQLKEEGLVDLRCNDAGAIFMESTVNFELSQLGGPQPMPMLSGMDILNSVVTMGSGPLYIPNQVNTEIPVLVINVSKFICGSIAVAANWHHTVADGFSGCHFMRSWAQVATGQALELLPSYDRDLLKPRSPPDASLLNNGGNYKSSGKLEPVQVSVRHELPAAQPSPVIKPFIVTQDTVQRLKEEVNCHTEVDSTKSSSNNIRRPFTTIEAVSAELWKLITKARSADSDEARRDRSRFFMFVDGRKRLGLPPGYFGNVVYSACAESTRDELLRRPLSYAAGLISNATRGINKEYFHSLIDWVQETGIKSSKCQSEHVTFTGFDVAATFWVFFPLYETNFGWGKPVLSVRNGPPRKFIDGISAMPGPDGKGNMVAMFYLHADRMDTLERDPEFKEVAEPLPIYNHDYGLERTVLRGSVTANHDPISCEP